MNNPQYSATTTAIAVRRPVAVMPPARRLRFDTAEQEQARDRASRHRPPRP
jgi:hypothetical protein